MLNKAKQKKQNKEQIQDPNELVFLNGNAVTHPSIFYPTIYLQNRLQKEYPYLELNNNIYITNSAIIDQRYACLSNIYPDITTKHITFKKIQIKLLQEAKHPKITEYIKQCLIGSILNLNQIFSLQINGKQTQLQVKSLDTYQYALITHSTNVKIDEQPTETIINKDILFDIKMKSYSDQLNKLYDKIQNKVKGKYLLYGLPGQGKTNLLWWLKQQNLFQIYFIEETNTLSDQLQQIQQYEVVVADEIDSWSISAIQNLFTSLSTILICTTNRPEQITANFDEKIEIVANNSNKLWQITSFILEQQIQSETAIISDINSYATQLYDELQQQGIQRIISSFSPADIQLLCENNKNCVTDYQLLKNVFIRSIPTYNSQYSVSSKEQVQNYYQDKNSTFLSTKLKNLIFKGQTDTFLLYGLPGTGKGLFIKYFSNISNISIITVNSTEIVSPYVGQTEINLKRIFQSKAQIIFFDECDSLLSQDSTSSKRVIQTFISHIERQQQIVICATNRPWFLPDQILNRLNNKLFYSYNTSDDSKAMIMNQMSQYIKQDMNNLDVFTVTAFQQAVTDMTNAMIIEVITRLKYIMINKNQLEISINDIIQTAQEVKRQKQINQQELDQFQIFNKKIQKSNYNQQDQDVEEQ